MKNVLLPALLGLLTLPALAQTDAQVRAVANFHAIQVGSGIELALTGGHTQRVEVSASTPELRDHLRTTVADGVLTISFDNPDQRWKNQRNTKLHVAVTADQLTALKAGSGSSVASHGNIAAATFQLDVSSGASLQADISTTTLRVSQGSGSSVSLSGRAPSLDIHAGSGASFDGQKLQTDHCRAEASSGASVQLAVKDDLDAQASSGGSISYSGSPQVTKHVSSGGSVGGR
ncbi:MAG: GIN domain-containing protein [Janthinobacterium lividum]